MDHRLNTERLLLRPFRLADAVAVAALCDNWNVARMVSRVPYPYGRDLAEAWIASHAAARAAGEEYDFCLELDGEPIGAVGLRQTGDDVYELGYWLGEPWWGRGFATEAARRVVRFAADDLDVAKLTSGHFVDNPASGYVLEKCGFRYVGDSMADCAARGEKVLHRCLELVFNETEGRARAS